LNELAFQAQEVKDKLLVLIDSDTEAFEKFMAANRLPQDTKKEKAIKEITVENSTKQSTIIPLETMRQSFKAIECAKVIAEKGMRNALSDAGVSAIAGLTAVKSAFFNVKINLPGIKDEKFKKEVLAEAEKILKDSKNIAGEIENFVMERFDADKR